MRMDRSTDACMSGWVERRGEEGRMRGVDGYLGCAEVNDGGVI